MTTASCRTIFGRLTVAVFVLAPGRFAVAPAQSPYDGTANARRDIESALYDAARDKKLVLLDFGANWCLDCQILHTLMEDSTVRTYLRDNFHIVRVDVGKWDKNLDLNRKYDNPIAKGIPVIVVLDRDGKEVSSTRNGSLVDARLVTPAGILKQLQLWVALKR